jgi:hypothetical protein
MTKSRVYSYAIIAQPFNERGSLWERVGKYRSLSNAERAIIDFTSDKVANLRYRIVPYFDGYYWRDEETEKQEYKTTNMQLWTFIYQQGLEDEARKFLAAEPVVKKKRFIFF